MQTNTRITIDHSLAVPSVAVTVTTISDSNAPPELVVSVRIASVNS